MNILLPGRLCESFSWWRRSTTWSCSGFSEERAVILSSIFNNSAFLIAGGNPLLCFSRAHRSATLPACARRRRGYSRARLRELFTMSRLRADAQVRRAVPRTHTGLRLAWCLHGLLLNTFTVIYVQFDCKFSVTTNLETFSIS